MKSNNTLNNEQLFAIARVQNSSNSKSQVHQVLDHMLMRGTISPVEAHELYRVYRLTSRIHDLKRAGVNINVNIKTDLTGRRYAEYALAGI